MNARSFRVALQILALVFAFAPPAGAQGVAVVADLIIVSQNIFEVNAHKIGATKVVTTILGGKVVYQADTK